MSFRWAWSHAFLTSKIPKEDRKARLIAPRLAVTNTTKFNKKSRKKKSPLKILNRLQRRSKILDRLQHLDVLLRVRSFVRWPLAVRFFSEDLWGEWEEQRRTLVEYGGEPYRNSIAFMLDLRRQGVRDDEAGIVKRRKSQHGQSGVGGLQGLDITYGISTMYHLDFTLILSQIVFNHVSKRSIIYSQNKRRVSH